MNEMIDISTQLGNLTLKNPIIPASGTFGFGYEMADWYDINCLGAISLKGTTLNARFGNETPRIAECASGMLNAVGLQNPGVDKVVTEEIPKLISMYTGPIIANISGFSLEEYKKTAQKLDVVPSVDILEVNISCPNVQHGGMAFGTSAKAAAEVTREVKKVAEKPVYIKLSPNVTNIVEIALACEEAGAEGIVLINTLLGMVINPQTGKPIVSTKMSGFSGPAIKPVALRMVYQVCANVKIPVIGVGGIANADDVLEFISAGASAVQVGTQTLIDPYACLNIIQTLPQVMAKYGIKSIQSIKGRSQQL